MNTRVVIVLLLGTLALLDTVPARAAFIEVAPQVKIYYETSGEGRPLLFVPGWTMTAGIWKEQIIAFSKTHQVVVMDPRCHGNSSKVLSGNTLEQQAKDLRRLIDALQLSDVTLVCWSMGVGVALEYTNQFGNDRLRNLVLVDGSPSMLKREDWPHGLTSEEIYHLLMQFENQRTAKTNELVDGMFKTERSDAELEWIVKEALRTPTTVSTLLGYDSFVADRRPLLSKIVVPTLLLMSPENKEIGEFMKSKIPSSELTVLDHWSHAMFVEDPKGFNERLEKFLKTTGSD
jgi:non-heme chloroperoxidase